MVSKSPIEWTETTWNPVAGYTVVSPGCTNYYDMRMATRLSLMGQKKYVGLTRQTGGRVKWNGRINCDYKTLEYPRKWKNGRTIFVNSMSDLFHENVPIDFIQGVFDVMNDTPQPTYQILTKRAERLEDLARKLTLSSNIWMEVSVENQDLLPANCQSTKSPLSSTFSEPRTVARAFRSNQPERYRMGNRRR